MTDRELIHTEQREGFDIAFYAIPEDESPRGHFMLKDGSDDEEMIEAIQRGDFAWFCAVVIASKCDIELAVDYLGACCYESAQAFVSEDSCYPDMVATVIAKAHVKLLGLAQ
jgi:hypothetical protein